MLGMLNFFLSFFFFKHMEWFSYTTASIINWQRWLRAFLKGNNFCKYRLKYMIPVKLIIKPLKPKICCRCAIMTCKCQLGLKSDEFNEVCFLMDFLSIRVEKC